MLRWLVTAALLVPASASAATVGTTCSGSCDYATLADAISGEAAGSTLVLQAETFAETVSIGKNLTIQGATTGTTTITGTVTITAGTVTLEDLTLDPSSGRCVTVSGTSTEATLDTIDCSGGVEQEGGGVWVDDSTLNIVNSIFDANTATGGAKDGGHLWAEDTATVNISGSTFTGGIADDVGGAIYATDSSLSITTTLFSGNTGVNGGALYISAPTSLSVTKSVFCTNSASNGHGGAIYVSHNAALTTHDYKNNLFVENSVAGGGKHGADLYFSGASTPKIINNHLLGGTSTGTGASVYSGQTITLKNNLIAHTSGDVAIQANTSSTASHNVFYNNSGGHSNSASNVGESTTGSSATDPKLRYTTYTGACPAVGTTSDDYWPQYPGSPLLDKGDSTMYDVDGLNPATTTSGTRADIGAYGGSGATGMGPWLDSDADTWEKLYDCDDTSASVYPSTYYVDVDGDTYGTTSTVTGCGLTIGYATRGGDCDDTKAAVKPGATEMCNGYDDDCDGTSDEDDASDATTWYVDADNDDYGLATTTKKACNEPSGYAAASGDCDDTRNTVHPGATEYCNGRDDDCDSATDEDDASDASTWYIDADGDDYGVSTTTKKACTEPTGYAAASGDCNDASSAVNPGATEVCNDIDDNCTGGIDEDSAADAPTWYRDSDGDTFGNPSSTDVACDQPSGYVADNTDCDDTDSGVKPGGTETCDGEDDDCDGTIDDGVKTTYYQDSDKDGYGNPSVIQEACSKPANYVTDNTDCDDTKSSVKPGATETCNSIDDDCDGDIDEGLGSTWYRDADADGYGNPADSKVACASTTGYVSNDTDCNDAAASIFPGATETCGDGIDSNCDGAGGPTDDEDGDGLSYNTEKTAGSSDCDTDSDDDKVLDGAEWGSGTTARDSDGDGTPDVRDTDDDNDTVPTATEGATDADGDGIPNHLDTDDDGDGLPTKDEKGGTTARDTDGDGVADYLDADDDGDTIPTIDEPGGDTDGDGLVNHLDDDDDGDGVMTEDEWAWGLDPYVVDSDSDTIDDSTEWGTGAEPRDTDGDGIVDPLDDDDDGDSIATLEEEDNDLDGAPIDGDPSKGCTPAADGVPNYLDDDSDGDGTPDSVEGTGDVDEDGVPNFLDCNDFDGCDGDADFDGLSNCWERENGTDPADDDTDGDGIKDGTEVGTDLSAPLDSDGDLVIDALDADDDGDGVVSRTEVGADPTDPQDTDEDGTPDYLDTDDDGDGLLTTEEDVDRDSDPTNDDTDGDDIPNYLDPNDDDGPDGDADGDGITNGREDELGLDKGSIDSDGDGVPDFAEVGDPDAPTDSDGDGTIDALDDDDDDDGIPTAEEGAYDTDGDGLPNHLDDDSDGDGLTDGTEGSEDPDCDGAPAFLDADETDGPCMQDGEDTDTDPPVTTEPPDCGCVASPGAGAGIWALGLALVTIRRRRSR